MRARSPRKHYRKRKCPVCGRWFMPDVRNAYHQYCCSHPACQKARTGRPWCKNAPAKHCDMAGILIR